MFEVVSDKKSALELYYIFNFNNGFIIVSTDGISECTENSDVDVVYVNIDEKGTEVCVYPNPATNYIFIDFPEPFA